MAKILRSIKKKISGKSGETLTETLGSLLIIVPGMVMLAGALVSASKINHQMKSSKMLILPSYTGSSNLSTDTTNISINGGSVSVKISWKMDGTTDTDSSYVYLQ